ncbi:MAG: diacylglycerol/polyprenol kinase family protein [Promethearchaeota archaeon]
MSLNPFSENLAWLWDIIALVISLTCVMMVVQINGKIQKSGKLPTYVTRKIVHILAAPVFMLTWLLFSGEVFSRYIASIVPILFIVQFTLIGTGKMEDEAFIRSMSRSGDPKELLKGTLYYAIILFVVTILWFTNGVDNANPGALIILGCLAGGDGFADIIGRKYGGEKKFGLFGAEKTIAGTIAMFLGSFIFSFGLLAIFSIGIPDFNLVQLILPIVIISLVVTIVEALSPPNSDNLTIPIVVVIIIVVFALWIPSLWSFPIISL